MFDNVSPGASSAVTSLVVLLAVAEALAQKREEIENAKSGRNLLFTLFDGETFDYIGSSRAVYDMVNKRGFPGKIQDGPSQAQLSLENILYFIEMNQILNADDPVDNIKLWLHKDNDTDKELFDFFLNNNPEKDVSFMKSDVDNVLPPSSLQTFLKHDRDIIGVVITNHNMEYTNHFYNSLLDDQNNLRGNNDVLARKLKLIATAMASALYKLVTGKEIKESEPIDFDIKEQRIEELLNCYLNNSACELFNAVLSPGQKLVGELSI